LDFNNPKKSNPMKQIVLLIVLCTNYFGISQDLHVGAKVGLNLSDFTGKNLLAFDQRTALHTGLTVELNFSELFSIQFEGLYTEQGAMLDNVNYPADYIAVPLFVKVYPSNTISIDLGAQFSKLLNDEVEEGETAQSIGIDNTDTALLGGLTYMTKFNLFVQARYLMGVSEIDPTGKWKNQVFQFSIGYNFM